MEFSGAGGKLIYEKNQKQKISWHCPFKVNFKIENFRNFRPKWYTQGLGGNWFIKKPEVGNLVALSL